MGFWVFVLPTLILVSCTPRRELEQIPVLQINGQSLSSKVFAEDLARQLRTHDALTVKEPATLLGAKEAVIREFVVRVVTESWAAKKKIEISDAELEKEIAVIRSGYPDDESFRQALAQENLAYEAWRSQRRSSLLQKRVAITLMEDLPAPTEGEIKKYFEENIEEFQEPEKVRLVQLVVTQESEAVQLYDRAKKGVNLGELAKKYSIAPEATNFGDTGWIPKGTLQVFDRAFSMQVGQLSPLLKSSYGFHIYRVTAKSPAKKLNLEQASPAIRNRLLAEREQSIFSAWLEEQLKSAKVLRNEAVINSIKVQTHATKQ